MKPLVVLLAVAGCTGNDGQLRAAWVLTLNGSPSDCANVGVAQVELVATPAGAAAGARFRFPCGAGSGTTDGLPPGDYAVSLSLVDAQDRTLLVDALPAPYTIAGGDVVSLGTIPMDVQARTVSMRLHFGSTSTSNCATGAGGAKVTAEQLVVTTLGDLTCLPFTLRAGTGVSSACQEGACRENDVVQVLSDLPRGTYHLWIQGYEGPAPGYPCYRTVSPIFFAITDADVDLGVVPVAADGSLDTAGCATPGCHCQ